MNKTMLKTFSVLICILTALLLFACGNKDSIEQNKNSDLSTHTHAPGEWYGNTATCANGGKERRDCTYSECDYFEERDTYALMHNYVDGTCAVCGTKGKYSEGLEYIMNYDKTSYGVSGIGTCYDSEIVIPPMHEGLPVDAIRYRAFKDNMNFTSIIIPDSVTVIAAQAFWGCKNLTSVTVGKSVSQIEERAFNDCTSLTSIDIPSGVTEIAEHAFSSCDSLTSVRMSDSVTNIEDYAFYKCIKLSNIKMPASLKSIGSAAFADCSSITSVNIPFGVTEIGQGAFSRCNNLESVYIEDLIAWCRIKFDSSEANPLNVAQRLYLNEKLVTELVIPEEIIAINDCAFSGYSGITSLTLPNTLKSIGNLAFYDCKNLEKVTFGSSLTTIGSSAFFGCETLADLIIPATVTYIGDWAFYNCWTLSEVVFEDKNGWSISYAGEKELSETDLENPAVVAEYFKRTYSYYVWKKT